MITLIPTKRGVGVELWGTYDDLSNFYYVIGKFWSDQNYASKAGFKNRDKLISSFSYEIRKAKEGSRLKKTHHDQEYLGTQFSWVHILFSLTAIKFNMRYYETTKFDISQILLIEFGLEKAMNAYDENGAKNLTAFIDDALYGANPHIYQSMRSINLEFFLIGGGKKAFRKLPELLKRGIFYTDEYRDYENFLKAEAARLNCDSTDLDIDDDHFDYESIKW